MNTRSTCNPSDHSMAEALTEVAQLVTGLGIMTFALFPFALPMIALTAVFVLPLVAVGLVAGVLTALVAAPIALVRRLRRQRGQRIPGFDRHAPGPMRLQARGRRGRSPSARSATNACS